MPAKKGAAALAEGAGISGGAAPAASADLKPDADFKPEVVYERSGEEPVVMSSVEASGNIWRAIRPYEIVGRRRGGRFEPTRMHLMFGQKMTGKEVTTAFYSYSWLGAREELAPRRDERLNPAWDEATGRWSIPLIDLMPQALHHIDPSAQLRIRVEVLFRDGEKREILFDLRFAPPVTEVATRLTYVSAKPAPFGSRPMVRYDLENPTSQKLRLWVRSPGKGTTETVIVHTHHASEGRVEAGQVVVSSRSDRMGSWASWASEVMAVRRDYMGLETPVRPGAHGYVPVEFGAGEGISLEFYFAPIASVAPICALPADQGRNFEVILTRRVCGGSANGFPEARGFEPQAIRDCEDVSTSYHAARTESWRTVSQGFVLEEMPDGFVTDPDVDADMFERLNAEPELGARIAKMSFSREGMVPGGRLEIGAAPQPLPQATCQGVY